MKEGPDIAIIGSLIGDPARANMLVALMSGKALTASELALEAGITPQTASSHLSKLEGAGMLVQRKQGRHRYFQIADENVGDVLESIMGLAADKGLLRTHTGPRDEKLRKARVCYNHLAGDTGVQLYDALCDQEFIQLGQGKLEVTDTGRNFFSGFGIQIEKLEKLRRPMCRECLDWSERRSHLAGSLGTALLDRFYDLGWAKRISGTRVVEFSLKGERDLQEAFSIK